MWATKSVISTKNYDKIKKISDTKAIYIKILTYLCSRKTDDNMKNSSKMIRHMLTIAALAATMIVSACTGSGSGEQATSQEAPAVQETPAPEQSQVTQPVANGPETPAQASPTAAQGKVIQMTTADFKKLIFNYEKNPENWVFEGERPCIVDFYADWCRPCKLVAPIMDELAAKYAGQIDIYKVNTDQERELSQVFGIRSIPSMLFCPNEGKPQMTQGALPKETYEEVIQNFLLGKGSVSNN